jgi:hypothetical protein
MAFARPLAARGPDDCLRARRSQVPRRCRPLSVTGLIVVLAVLAATAVLCPTRASAQSADPNANTQPADPNADADLLQPSLQTNPNNPPTFVPGNTGTAPADQAPPAGQFTAPSRIGATPVYGSPTGFGAADTGFNSSNTAKRQRLVQAPDSGVATAPPATSTFDPVPELPPEPLAQPPVLAPPPPPVVYPARAAARPGATLPPPPDQLPISNPPSVVYPLTAANRPGASLPIPAAEYFQGSASTPVLGAPPPNTLPLGTVPVGTLPIGTSDPYEALGIKVGSFLILPAVELSGGYNTNPQHVPGGAGSVYYVVAPELHVRSQWASNSLTADIVGSYTGYENGSFTPSLNAPYLNAKIDGTLDVTRDTQILLEGRSNISTTNPGSPNLQAGLSALTVETTFGGTAGVDQQLGRFDISLKGTADRSVFANSQLVDGTNESNDWQDFDQYAGILRLGYETALGVKPFVELSEDTRTYDTVDIYGEDRSSDGSSGKFGVAFAIPGWLTGEMAVGYLQRTYDDAVFQNVSGVTFDGSLLWQATALTSAKFTAATGVYESIVQGVSGSLSRDFNVEVDHALRTWLIAIAQVGYGNDDYVGLNRDDNRYFALAGLTYKLSREMQLKGTVREDWLTSNVSGVAYTATSFLLTLRLQR